MNIDKEIDFSKAIEASQSISKYLQDIGASVKGSAMIIPKNRNYFDVGYVLPEIVIPRDPNIKLNENILQEVETQNKSLTSLNHTIEILKSDAIKTEIRNRRTQWIIAIMSAVVSALVTFIAMII